jgi:hypothetical protein
MGFLLEAMEHVDGLSISDRLDGAVSVAFVILDHLVCRRSRSAVSDRYASFERKSAGFSIRTFRHLRSRRR